MVKEDRDRISAQIITEIESLTINSSCSSIIKEQLISSFKRCSETSPTDTFKLTDSVLTVTTPLFKALGIVLEIDWIKPEARPVGQTTSL